MLLKEMASKTRQEGGNDPYSPGGNITGVAELTVITMTGIVAHTTDVRNAYEVLFRKPDVKTSMEKMVG